MLLHASSGPYELQYLDQLQRSPSHPPETLRIARHEQGCEERLRTLGRALYILCPSRLLAYGLAIDIFSPVTNARYRKALMVEKCKQGNTTFTVESVGIVGYRMEPKINVGFCLPFSRVIIW